MSNRTLFKSRALTQARLLELLHYDPTTGAFTRRRGAGGQAAGSECGGIDPSNGYRQIMVDYRNYDAQRLAFLYMLGRWPEPEADHENGDRDDNRWVNLRDATRGEQAQNMAVRSDSVSGVRGVGLTKGGKYSAAIRVGGVRHFLGNFATAEEAHAAYLAAKARLHPFQPVPRDVETA
jgi:hypothetical protein